MKITIGQRKGGVAKTATAIHLATYLARRDGPGSTLLVDADPNLSACVWAGQSEEGEPGLEFPVVALEDFRKLKDIPKHIVIDTRGGADQKEWAALAKSCDVLILPSKPEILDIAAAVETCELLDKAGCKNYKLLLTIVPSGQKEEAEAREDLEGYPVATQSIRRSTAIAKAAARGVAVDLSKHSYGGRVWLDYRKAFDELLGGLS
jgi:chromosome partitioning protein